MISLGRIAGRKLTRPAVTNSAMERCPTCGSELKFTLLPECWRSAPGANGPDPWHTSASVAQKCCFKECETRGIPAKGFDFFACVPCLDELGRLLEQGRKERPAPAPKENQ